MHNGRLSCERV